MDTGRRFSVHTRKTAAQAERADAVGRRGDQIPEVLVSTFFFRTFHICLMQAPRAIHTVTVTAATLNPPSTGMSIRRIKRRLGLQPHYQSDPPSFLTV